MIPDPRDTIVALSSAPGPGGRAIVRVSGPGSLACALTRFRSVQPIDAKRRWCYAGQLYLDGVHSPLPADLYIWPGPKSYTGQDVVEIHTLSSPPLVDALLAHL